MEAISMGEHAKQVAARLRLSTSTVRTHLHKAYERLEVLGAARAVARMHASGWLRPDCEELRTVAELGLTTTDRRRWLDSHVTPAQHLYLDQFERHLRERTAESRGRMSHAFVSMCHERDVPDRRGSGSRQGRVRDPLSRLLRDVMDGIEADIT